MTPNIFFAAMFRPLGKVLTFSGRDARATFWPYMVLLAAFYFLSFGVAFSFIATSHFAIFPALAAIMVVLVLLASAAVVRRMHDVGWGAVWMAAYVVIMAITASFMIRMDSLISNRSDALISSGPDAFQTAMMPMMILSMIANILALIILVVCCLPGSSNLNKFGDPPVNHDR